MLGYNDILVVLVIAVVLLINLIMAYKMQAVVEKKGCTELRVVMTCFVLGLAGYLYVIALPDLELRKMLKSVAASNEQGASLKTVEEKSE